ncbi:MAG: diacylglycerol kinase family protein [Planctomycetota bacterium]|nr:diacylglycerol kinase family protein [Planctomycetota bacterium]MDA1213371.1 diacylglycerol kinase family protein [Planctomycetota bacterium]
MKPNSRFSLVARYDSFRYAYRGVVTLLKTEHNTWVHLAATIAVTLAGLFVGLSQMEWCWIVFAVAGVWTAEAFNTSIEFLTDLASEEFHPLAAKTKDVASAAVLFAAIGAATVGILVFWPYVVHFSSLGVKL